MDTDKKRRVLQHVAKQQDLIDEMVDGVLRVLTHPDATPQQVMAVRDMLLDMRTRVEELNQKLLKAGVRWPVTHDPAEITLFRRKK